jgi:hypothetical protein
LRHQLEHITQTLPNLWNAGQLANEHKKLLLRSLIARVILKRTAPDRVEVKIVWVSGHFSMCYVQPPILRECDVSGYDQMVQRVRELWSQGRTDEEIAAQLTEEGFHSARSSGVVPVAVQKIRLHHKWHVMLHRSRGANELDGYLTPAGLAKLVGVDRSWVYRHLERGQIDKRYYTRHPQSSTYLIVKDPDFIASLRQAVKCKPRSQGGS